MMREVFRRDETALTWSSVATTATMVAPDTDTAIDCRNAKRITIQIDQSATTYAGANTDLLVLTRCETATTYDTVPYASVNSLGSAAVQTLSVTPGPSYIKCRVNNDSTLAKCAPKVVVQLFG